VMALIRRGQEPITTPNFCADDTGWRAC